jgi:hypothetical protein
LGVDSSSRLTTLTTDFHEFIGQVTKENQAVLQYGPFFQWDEKVRKDNPVPSGPLNPQALNRYSYVLNNPLRYVDPTGHEEFKISLNDLITLRDELQIALRNYSAAAVAAGAFSLIGRAVEGGATSIGEPRLQSVAAALGRAMQWAGGIAAAGLGYRATEIQSVVDVLNKAIGDSSTVKTGVATLEFKHTDSLGFMADLRCASCTDPGRRPIATLTDYQIIGPRNEVTMVLWGYFSNHRQ